MLTPNSTVTNADRCSNDSNIMNSAAVDRTLQNSYKKQF